MCRAALPTGSPRREVSAGTFQPPPLWGPPPQVGVRELEPAATPPPPPLAAQVLLPPRFCPQCQGHRAHGTSQ